MHMKLPVDIQTVTLDALLDNPSPFDPYDYREELERRYLTASKADKKRIHRQLYALEEIFG